jgi:hypothetical protein
MEPARFVRADRAVVRVAPLATLGQPSMSFALQDASLPPSATDRLPFERTSLRFRQREP